LRRDAAGLLKTTQPIPFETVFSIYRLAPSPTRLGLPRNRWIAILDLTRLPLAMQNIISLLLLIPLGASLTALARNIVGIRTFGTFTPALIALSFIRADWRTGGLVVIVILGLGLVSRYTLEKFRLLMVPRLGIVLTLIILGMILAVSLLDYLGLTPSAGAVLLPTVILTFVVERFIIISEEDSVPQALYTAAGTVLVALLCYLILRWELLAHLILTYPELLLANLAFLLLLGRYTGYRLSELWRFRAIADQPSDDRSP